MFLTYQIAQNKVIYFTYYTAHFAYYTAIFITSFFLYPFYCNYSSSELHASARIEFNHCANVQQGLVSQVCVLWYGS